MTTSTNITTVTTIIADEDEGDGHDNNNSNNNNDEIIITTRMNIKTKLKCTLLKSTVSSMHYIKIQHIRSHWNRIKTRLNGTVFKFTLFSLRSKMNW